MLTLMMFRYAGCRRQYFRRFSPRDVFRRLFSPFLPLIFHTTITIIWDIIENIITDEHCHRDQHHLHAAYYADSFDATNIATMTLFC